MVMKYNTVVESVQAIQFTFDNLKDIYTFLEFRDCTFSIKSRILSGIITDKNGTKLSVAKEDFVVKNSSGQISIWTATEFNKKFVEANASR